MDPSRCCRENLRPEVCQLYHHLLENLHRYMDKREVLNSDGRRLLHKITKMLLEDAPRLRNLVAKARKNPTLENILKLGREVTKCLEEVKPPQNIYKAKPYLEELKTPSTCN